MKRVWLTWETHRRSVELARAFNAEYFSFDFSQFPRLIRYARSAAATVRVLRSLGRGDVAFAQSPSIFLASLAAVIKVFRGYVLVIDAHNAVPNYHDSGRPLLEWVVRFSTARADLVLVTNEALTDPIRAMGGIPAVLPDRLPAIRSATLPERLAGGDLPVVTLISSFNWDEPIQTFIDAAHSFEVPFLLCITGRKEKAGDLLRHESETIRFTGYLPDSEFEGLIGNSDLLIDLTVDDKVLVCGAYEAVSVGVPLVLIDSAVARRLFTAGVIFAENSREGYQGALKSFFDDRERFSGEMKEFRPVFEERWMKAFQPIDATIDERAGAARPSERTGV